MNKRALSIAVLFAIVACQGTETTRPDALPIAFSPAHTITDGTDVGGNPDFFFLTPIAPNPDGHPNWDANGFNPNLQPKVRICAISAPGAACGTPTTTTQILAATNGNHYAQNWSVPVAAQVYYRIEIVVGEVELGSAEVQTAAKTSSLKNVNPANFVLVQDGGNLPIRFRIEQYALCETPGQATCASKTINLTNGGDVKVPIPDVGDGGVTIPPQGTGGNTTVTVKLCDEDNVGFESMNPAVTDLPTYGPCISVTTDPPLPPSGLLNAATVFICDITPLLPPGMDHEQTDRVTLHRYDPGTLHALPHAPHACGQTASAARVKGFFASLRAGELRDAGKQLVSLFTPRMLHAAVLDVGAGGFTFEFSAFQFALPSKLQIVEGNNQTGLAGATLALDPKVIVTDLGGLPVEGATVRFVTDVSACLPGNNTASSEPDAVVTTADGTASTEWTLSATPGSNTLLACGRGLAGDDNNGPRVEEDENDPVDPFQPIQAPFDGPTNPPGGPVPVLVGSGSVAFSATGATSVTVIGFGDNGYNSYGPFPISGPVTLPAGWPLPTTPGVSGTIGGDSPFGGNYTGCSINTGFGGITFPVDSDILVTKAFTTPNAGTVAITVHIDNDAKVYLDGVEITSSGAGTTGFNEATTYNGVSGWWIHDGCADIGAPVFTIPNVAAGQHTLSIWAHDRGTVGYLNAEVVLTPP